MPYSSKKTGKNEITVYKKDSGEMVGKTTPEKYDAYMAALHIHEPKGMAEGGRVPEQLMDALARNREEIGLPATEGGAGVLMDHVPGINLLKMIGDRSDLSERLGNPELLHNTAGKGLETNFQHGSPGDTFGKEADVQMLSEGGVAGIEGLMSNPNPVAMKPEMETAGTKDPADIPEEIRDFVEKAHKDIRESRPDENWRIKPTDQEKSMAPYKKDEKDMESDVLERLKGFDKGGMIPGYDEGGGPGIPQPFDVDGGASDTVKMDGLVPPPPPAAVPTPVAPPAAPIVPRGTMPGVPPPSNAPMPSAPGLTDQDFMDRANKMLGLNPEQQAGFMKLLGSNAQKGQIGAGIAGIGDAIAAGGTLGKVNPGGLGRSEDLIQNKTKEGIEGMQTIRENQGKAAEMADKLESRDPQSPLSKWAQKAYGPVGKKIGLNLDNASAALIGDVTGKGVEALNTEYQNQLKLMGVELQKKQVEATIGNQKAERDIAREGHQADAAKTLADRGILKTLANAVPGTSGHRATQVLEKQALGQSTATATGPYGAETVRNGKTYEWSPETGKYHLKQ